MFGASVSELYLLIKALIHIERTVDLCVITKNKYDVSYLKTSRASTLRSMQELSWQPFSVG